MKRHGYKSSNFHADRAARYGTQRRTSKLSELDQQILEQEQAAFRARSAAK